jgi:hypothetical protein
MKAVVFHRSSAIDAYQAFDKRQPGWMKVELRPEARNSVDRTECNRHEC